LQHCEVVVPDPVLVLESWVRRSKEILL